MYRVGSTSDRGAAGLTSEPSLLGIYSAMYFAIIKTLSNRIPRPLLQGQFILSKQMSKLNISLLLMMFSVIFSASMMGYLFFIVILFFQKQYKLIVLALLACLLIMSAQYDDTKRIFTLIRYVVSLDFKMLLSDASIMHRLNSFVVAFNPAAYEVGLSLSAGLTPIIYYYGLIGQIIVIMLILCFRPLYEAFVLSTRSIALMCAFAVMIFVGPMTIIPFWFMVALERRYD
jgi:hypothetical protein